MTAEPLVGEGAPEPQLTYERGWHPDPADPKRERWHDGRAFTQHTHRALRRASYLGAELDRSMWPGANVDARRAQSVSYASSLAFLLVIACLLAFALALVPWASTALGIAMFLFAVFASAQVYFGIRGIKRASRDGGMGIAISVVLQGSIFFVMSVGYLTARVVLSAVS